MKRLIRGLLGMAGYSVRHVGRGVGGVDLLHDAKVLLGGRKGPVLFDVGANVGQTALAMRAKFPGARIYSFEPSPATHETLRRALAGKPGMTVEAIALGAAEGRLPFHATGDYSVNHSLLVPTWNAGGETIEVPVLTLDGYCATHGIERIDLLKVDTQGNDLNVLRGAKRMLASVRLVSCEAIFEPMYVGQPTLAEITELLAGAGYHPVGFYEPMYFGDRLASLDILFRRL